MKVIKSISWFLGISMFMFGILKVVIPTINGWYSVQMTNSGLGEYIPIWVGIAGEIIVGLALIISLVIDKNLTNKIFRIIIQFASAAIIPMMLTSCICSFTTKCSSRRFAIKNKTAIYSYFHVITCFDKYLFDTTSNKKQGKKLDRKTTDNNGLA